MSALSWIAEPLFISPLLCPTFFRTFPTIEQERDSDAGPHGSGPVIIFDLPRPKCDPDDPGAQEGHGMP
jgi:hypothetical protein